MKISENDTKPAGFAKVQGDLDIAPTIARAGRLPTIGAIALNGDLTLELVYP